MIHNCLKFAIASAAAAVMIATSAVNAQMVTNLDDDGPGSLREAITTANSTPVTADMIVFDPSLSGTIELESQLPDLRTPMTIDGDGRITLDAGDGEDGMFATGDGFRIFNVDDDEGDSFDPIDSITLRGLTLTGGDTPIDGGSFESPGGAIRNKEILNLENVQVVDNAAGGGGTDFPDGIDGGGIINIAGLLTLTDCTVSGNKAGDGATAVGMGRDATGGSGGGIFSSTSSRSNFRPFLVLINTTVSGNLTGRAGTNDGAPAPGGRGGGIFSVSNTAIINSTISGNSTDNGTAEFPSFNADGGGISFTGRNRSLTIVNSTITDNVVAGADSGGGGIYSISEVVVENSIIAGNIADDADPDVHLVAAQLSTGTLELNYSLVGQADVVVTSGADNLIGVSPNLGPLANNGGTTQTHALLAGSPAIDAGDPGFDPMFIDGLDVNLDQRGDARVGNGTVDIGAVEFSPDDGVFVLGDANGDGVVSFLDITPFIANITGDVFQAESDIDGNGVVNFLDITPFIALLTAL